MNVIINIIDCDTNENEVCNVYDVFDKSSFDFYDTTNCLNHISVFDNGVIIKRQDKDHITTLNLIEGFAEIESNEGLLKFQIKILDLKNSNDRISMSYKINDITKQIIIEYK